MTHSSNRHAHLTTRLLKSLKPLPGRRYLVWDDELSGFGVEVQHSGALTFFVNYRVRGYRTSRRCKLGRYGDLTIDQARTRARQTLLQVADGHDPLGERQARTDAPTVKALGADWLDHVTLHHKPRTADEYRRLWEKHIEGPLGSTKVADVTKGQVMALHKKLHATPYIANRVVEVVGSFFTFAMQQGARADDTNPARGVRAYPEKARERFLTPAEVARLGEALATAEREGVPPAPTRRRKRKTGPTAKHATKKSEKPQPANPYAIAALRFLLLSGWREREALTLKWSDIDTDRQIATLADTKTGKSQRPLGAPALALLDELPRIKGCEYVFPGRDNTSPLVEINRVWYAVRHAAGLDNVRLHDLRHSYASAVASAPGGNLLLIAKLLGHKNTRTTERYAHLFADPVRQAADETAKQISGWLATPAALEVAR